MYLWDDAHSEVTGHYFFQRHSSIGNMVLHLVHLVFDTFYKQEYLHFFRVMDAISFFCKRSKRVELVICSNNRTAGWVLKT